MSFPWESIWKDWRFYWDLQGRHVRILLILGNCSEEQEDWLLEEYSCQVKTAYWFCWNFCWICFNNNIAMFIKKKKVKTLNWQFCENYSPQTQVFSLIVKLDWQNVLSKFLQNQSPAKIKESRIHFLISNNEKLDYNAIVVD